MIRSGDLSNHAVRAATLTTRPAGRSGDAGSSPARSGIIDLQTHPEPIVTVAELAAYWKVHPETIWRHCRKGALPYRKLPGGQIRIRIEDARAYGRPSE